MLLLAHTGLTLAAAVAADRAVAWRRRKTASPFEAERFPLLSRIDIRLLMIGSLLPDIIDKPVGLWLFRDTFESGRIFGHTLLFLVLLLVAGLAVYAWSNRRRARPAPAAGGEAGSRVFDGASPAAWRGTGLLVLAAGAFAHLVLDRVWAHPTTLLWPFLGPFPRTEHAGIPDWLETLVTNQAAYIPEIIGGVVLVAFAVMVVYRGRMGELLRHGRV